MPRLKVVLTAIREIEVGEPDEEQPNQTPRGLEASRIINDPWSFLNDKRTDVSFRVEEFIGDKSPLILDVNIQKR